MGWSTDYLEGGVPACFPDFKSFPPVSALFLAMGLSEEDLIKFIGGNAIRVQKEVLGDVVVELAFVEQSEFVHASEMAGSERRDAVLALLNELGLSKGLPSSVAPCSVWCAYPEASSSVATVTKKLHHQAVIVIALREEVRCFTKQRASIGRIVAKNSASQLSD